MAKDVNIPLSMQSAIDVLLQRMRENPPDISFHEELLEEAKEALDSNNLFKAQHSIYQAIQELKESKEKKLLNTSAYPLLDKINETCKPPKLKVGDTFSFSSPLQIGASLWICKYDELPPDIQLLAKASVGFFILDTSSLANEKFDGFKGLRDGEKVYLKKLIGTRFDKDSVFPNEEVVITREKDTVKVLDPSEAVHPASLIKNASYARLLAARGQINKQVYSGELKGKDHELNTKLQFKEISRELERRVEEIIKKSNFYKTSLSENSTIKVSIVNGDSVSVTKKTNKDGSKIITIKVGHMLLKPLDYKGLKQASKRKIVEALDNA